MNDNIRKKSLEDAIEIQIKELFDSEIHNNESFNLKVQKMTEILSQLPNEPVENEYLKEIFLRVRRKIDLNENYENN
tara:strand:+ start:162 stop:392 length:231 start_codon:yes stop_codon:yes gene_type:complete